MPGPGDREREDPGPKGLSSLAEGYRKAAPYIGASTSLVASVGLFTLVGIWLDGRFGTTPWLMLLWLGLGLAAGFRGVLRAVRRADREAAHG